MEFDRDSFLAGLAVGMQIKGWATAPRNAQGEAQGAAQGEGEEEHASEASV